MHRIGSSAGFVHRVIAATNDQPRDSHGDHGWRDDGQAAGHLGHHEHDGQGAWEMPPKQLIMPTIT